MMDVREKRRIDSSESKLDKGLKPLGFKKSGDGEWKPERKKDTKRYYDT